ncbi:uncharacterized protein [Typha angustifolia]|uniref:uncharacterized protein n=1 Tax=Typha angustifolia TaxID=59011 RepID=UPI003C2DF152
MASACPRGRELASNSFRKLIAISYRSHLLAFRGAHYHPLQKNFDDQKDAAAAPPAGVSKAKPDRAHVAQNSKNVEEYQEEAVATVLPDEMIEGESESFWVPDPETGVFVPAEEGDIDVHGSLPIPPHTTGDGGSSSVLEQTVWVRELEVEEFERPPPPCRN